MSPSDIGTLRDQYAMAALTGWLSSFNEGGFPDAQKRAEIAKNCFLMADEMMQARVAAHA
jgi:hypothetical protein